MASSLLIFQYPIIIRIPFKEEEIFIIIKEVVFYFLSSEIDKDFVNLTKTRYDFTSINFSSHLEHLFFK
jgi:magnesium transporter